MPLPRADGRFDVPVSVKAVSIPTSSSAVKCKAPDHCVLQATPLRYGQVADYLEKGNDHTGNAVALTRFPRSGEFLPNGEGRAGSEAGPVFRTDGPLTRGA